MRVFRLCRKKYAHELSGWGAARSNNRWNSKGVEMIYTAESRALAMAEVAVHLSLSVLPADYMMLEILLPDYLAFDEVLTDRLPENWASWPPSYNTQDIGNAFIAQSHFDVLKVPSAVVKGDFNFLIHPFSPNFNQLKITHAVPFQFDTRLFKL